MRTVMVNLHISMTYSLSTLVMMAFFFGVSSEKSFNTVLPKKNWLGLKRK